MAFAIFSEITHVPRPSAPNPHDSGSLEVPGRSGIPPVRPEASSTNVSVGTCQNHREHADERGGADEGPTGDGGGRADHGDGLAGQDEEVGGEDDDLDVGGCAVGVGPDRHDGLDTQLLDDGPGQRWGCGRRDAEECDRLRADCSDVSTSPAAVSGWCSP